MLPGRWRGVRGARRGHPGCLESLGRTAERRGGLERARVAQAVRSGLEPTGLPRFWGCGGLLDLACAIAAVCLWGARANTEHAVMAVGREAGSGGLGRERGRRAAVCAWSRGGVRGMHPRTQAHGPWWPWCRMSRATCAQRKEDTAVQTLKSFSMFGSGRLG